MAPNLLLHSVSRTRGSEIEKLTFEPGVNLLVGPRNSGKTKWLQTIDFLFGDDIDANERTTDDIFAKYDSAAMSLSIGAEQFTIERLWKRAGMMSKVLVNEDALLVKDFREFLMEKLDIPIIRYPQGNPLGTRTWPELGWRSLLDTSIGVSGFGGTSPTSSSRASSTPASCNFSALQAPSFRRNSARLPSSKKR